MTVTPPGNTEETSPWQRLARYVAARRHDRGWKQEELAQQAGVSVSTVRNIEGAKPVIGPRRPTSWPRLERALGWESGSCEAIVDGREPTLAQGEAPRAGEVVPIRLRDALSRGELADYRVIEIDEGVTGIVLVRADSDVPTERVIKAVVELDRKYRDMGDSTAG